MSSTFVSASGQLMNDSPKVIVKSENLKVTTKSQATDKTSLGDKKTVVPLSVPLPHPRPLLPLPHPRPLVPLPDSDSGSVSGSSGEPAN